MKIAEWINTGMFQVIGWSIIHSIWQFLILFAALKALLMVISKKDANLRYYTGILFLCASVICPVLTFQHEYGMFFGDDGRSVAALANTIKSVSVAKAAAGTIVVAQLTTPAQVLLNLLDYISPYLTLAWIPGMVLCLIKIVKDSFYLNALKRLPGDAYPEASKKLNFLRNKMKIGRTVKLIIHKAVPEPLTFGHLKPVILLPCSYVAMVPVEQLEMILAHELAHIKRYDYLINLIQTALGAIYFYNPFFRAMNDMVRTEREYCCDDMAAKTCGDSETMALALANLKIMTGQPKLALAAAANKNAFYERVTRLTSPSRGSGSFFKNPFAALTLIALTLLFLTKCVYDHGQNSNMPAATDPIKQLLTDNQANYKEQLFNFTKGDKVHEIFLVSTVNGAPLYAYLDGAAASKTQLAQIVKVLQQKRNMTPAEIAAMKKAAIDAGPDRHWKIHVETDSINKIISAIKDILATRPSGRLEKRLKELDLEVNARNKEEVALSMAAYKDQIKNIGTDIKLHVLLTKIIAGKEYTPAERQELTNLVKKKQGV